MTFIAGPYVVSYNGTTVGQCRDITIEHFVNKQLITGDNLAATPQDAVYQGMEVFVEFTMMEHDNVFALDAFWPYSGTDGVPGQVGRLDVASSLAKVLLLTAVAGTTAGAVTLEDFNATLAILAEGFPVRILQAPALKEVPIRMRLYPDVAQSNRFYFFTASA